jgi:hypothetical protein
MLVELRQSINLVLLDRMEMIDPPMPGQWFVHDQASYLVMQRRHRYKLRSGRYELSSIVLLVKAQKQPADAHFVGHGWVIGDSDCRFNALSPLLRCAVLPDGPCDRCAHREAR